MEKLKNKYLEIGELTKEQIKWINKEISGTLDIDRNYYMYGYSFPDLKFIFFSFDCVTHEGPEQISFEEFKEIYESYKFVLPKKWCIKGCEELAEYLAENGINNRKLKQRSDILNPIGGDQTNYYYFKTQYPDWDFANQPEGEVITFEQFKEHVLKEKYHDPEFNENPKEIIGYKLVKENYKEAFSKITDTELEYINTSKRYPFHFSKHCSIYDKMLELNLLDIWCEPVYKPETITLKSGIELSESDIKELEALIEIRKVCKSLANEN